LNKKFLAVALATLMILSILPALAVADGNYPHSSRVPNPTVRAAATERDCDLFQSENDYNSAPLPPPPLCIFMHPGVVDEYKNGWSHTLDTLWGMQSGQTVPGQMDTNAQTRQVFDKYLDYAIMASSSDSIGDIQFDVSVVTPIDNLQIFVPPEFKFLAKTAYESVWTDITNDYRYISIGTRNEYDSIAPHWTRISIGGSSMQIQSGVYHVRLFNLRAPDVVGLYHFKIYYSLTTSTATVSLGAGNYPIVVVKGELNPAWVQVTVRTHNMEAEELGGALVSGVVEAVGTSPAGREVKGRAYWGPIEFVGNNPVPPGPIGALYRVFIFGLPAGTYTITGQASGFEPGVSERFTVNAGQSYHIVIVLIQSPVVSVTVWSKHGTGAIPWHNLWQLPYGTNCPTCAIDPEGPMRDIFFDLYDAKGNLLSFWGTDDQNSAKYPAKQQSSQRGIPLNNLLNYDWVTGVSTGLPPADVSTHFTLTDNFDLLGTPRGITSTNWDGHVPWDIPDYINGIVQGQYTLEAFVTGYIMDEAEAYQRSLTVNQLGPGIHYELQMDLRRTNWIEQVIHLPGNFLAGPEIDVTLVALDKNMTERGAAAFELNSWLGFEELPGGFLGRNLGVPAALDGKIDGCDLTGGHNVGVETALAQCVNGRYMGGIVIEGWNALFPNYGAYGVRDLTKPMTGTVTDQHKDYGLNPTKSSHSDQAVQKRVGLAGNPYTIQIYMTDMGAPSGYNVVDPSPPVHYTNVPVAGTGWYSIIGGDPQVSVFLCNSPVSLSYSIVNASAWISLRSVDFEVPAHSRPWTFPGAEIKVEFMDATSGDVIDTLDPTIYGLFQDPGTTEPGYEIIGAADHCRYDGRFVGSYGYTPFDVDNKNCPGQHEHIGVWYYGTDWSSAYGIDGDVDIYETLLADAGSRSTRLPAGEYTYTAYTYGYIMRRSFPMFVPQSGQADIEADMIQGGQVRVGIEFFNENVKTPFNGWIWVEVFNDKGKLVGATIYGQAQPNCYARADNGVDGCTGTYHYYEPEYDWQIVAGPSQGAGLDGTGANPARGYIYSNWPNDNKYDSNYQPSVLYPSNSFGQRAYWSKTAYGVPQETWANYRAMNPSEANRVEIPAASGADVDVFGFYQYYSGAMRTWAGGWPTSNKTSWADSGIMGSIDIPGWAGSGGGLYSLKVWAFDPFGPNNVFDAEGFSDDWRMYAQAVEIKNLQVPWGGLQEVYVRMDNMAKLEGVVRWYDMFGNLRPLPWAQISATNPSTAGSVASGGSPAYSSGLGAVGAGSTDPSGAYIMWLPAGSHDVKISTSNAAQVWASGQGVSGSTFNSGYTVVVSPGWVGGGDSSLADSGTPVPEVPAYLLPLTLIAALAASVWLLRKKNLTITNIPVLMK